jgi:hypothetical protein
MRPEFPSYHAMKMAKYESDVAFELSLMGTKVPTDNTSLGAGTRVYFLSIEGEFAGTVQRPWCDADTTVWALLDCKPDSLIRFHRSLFREFSILDHIARM